jgi:hypothetical protein
MSVSLVATFGNVHVEMAGWREALRVAGARVFSTDIIDRGCCDQVFDFLSPRQPRLARFGGIITNPPFGDRGRLAVSFIEAGLRRIADGGFLALLLPADFDSAKTRTALFRECPHFIGKIVLTQRIVWFERGDGVREAPKENHHWFLWSRAVLRDPPPPVILYAPPSRN